MSTYVISDIHGEYEMFMGLLKRIQLCEGDTLYILGDILDRGPHPIKTVLELMEMPNAVCLAGNHELMAMKCLNFLMREITDESIDALDEKMVDNILTWQYNGSRTTIEEFRALSRDMQRSVVEFIEDFIFYEELTAGGKDYLLVHGGLGNFSPDRDIDDYSPEELLWTRADYGVKYFEDIFVVTGHTPTQLIDENPRPGYVFRRNNHIAIDCGSYRPDGRLAAVCLDTEEESYSER